MLEAFVALVFVATGLVVWMALSMLFGDERAVAHRLSSLTVYETGQAEQAHPVLLPFRDRVFRPMSEGFAGIAGSIAPEGYRKRVRHRLVLAGNPRAMSVGRFVGAKALTAAGMLALFVGVSAITRLSSLAWLGAAVLVVIGFFLPDLWLSSVITDRQAKIRHQLPDFLDMLTISVEAGLGFDAAISKLVRTAHGPLAREFALMLKQVQAGADRSEALRAMGERTEVPDLNAFIAAIVQAEQFGISIAGVLRGQAKEMRLKRRQFAEEQAQKVPVKIVFPLVLCILPATMIVILGPAIVSIGQAFGLL